MHIAIDIRCLMEKELTGVGEYTLQLLTHLFAQDNTNEYYLFYNSNKDVSRNLPRFSQTNVHFCGFNYPNKLLNFSLKFFKWPKLDKLIDKKINLFFFPNITFAQTDCPYIITAHDLSFELFPEFLSWKNRLWHYFINPKRLFQNAQSIIAVSNNTAVDLMTQYKISADKIKTIHSGVSADYRIIDKNDSRLVEVKQKYNLPDKFILFLGTVEPRKNVNTLINAFTEFKQQTGATYSLVIAGKCKSTIASQSTNQQINLPVSFINFVTAKDKPYLYNLASLFVYPSFYEGFGFPPIEAMACGCPVITSNNSSLTEICENAAMLINARRVNDLADAMKDILTDEELKNHFIQKGLERVKQFEWEKTAKETRSGFEGFETRDLQ
ncbi:MAG: glycosyltransferase family 1 protein [Parcubacteria group bacterium]